LLVQIFAILAMLGILSVLIIVHECGHFSVARFFGFQTPVFGFGLPFGPHWVVGKKWGTEFRIHACLLGGYVAIPELGDESNQDAFGVPLKPFRKFPIWQRALVAFAGVGMNIIFAYLVTLVMFFSMGAPVSSVIIGGLPPENPIAAQAGVKVGDELAAINDFPITSSTDAVTYLGAHKKTPVTLHMKRDNKQVNLDMTTNADGKVGMQLDDKAQTYQKCTGNPIEIAGQALNQLGRWTWSMIDNLGQMVQGLFSGGKPATPGHPKIGLQDLHGVLAVIKIGADIAQQDWSKLLIFTIMISMDLAIINLVPWPALDGGHLAFMTFEAIRGRPMGEQALGEIVKWGFMGLMVLMVVIMANDVTALVTGKLDIKKKDAAITKDKGGTDSNTPVGSKSSAESKPPAVSKSDDSNSTPASESKAGSATNSAPSDDKSSDANDSKSSDKNSSDTNAK
jgi:membrane-associated protease RseP (regulator of RpoE activity)